MLHATYILLLFFSFCTYIAEAQDNHAVASIELARVKFSRFSGGIVMFPVLINHQKDTLNFIMDTGSSGMFLDSVTALRTGIAMSRETRRVRGIGGPQEVAFSPDNVLQINGLYVSGINFHIINLSVLSSMYGKKIDGIAGSPLLMRYILKINYDRNEMAFWSPGKIKYPKKGMLLKPYITTLPYLQAFVADETEATFNHLADIGAGLSILFSENYLHANPFIAKNKHRFLKQAEGLGGKINMQLTLIKKLKLGKYTFRNVPVNIFKDEHNISNYPTMGGIIGNDIYRRFNCIFNYPNKEFHLLPNKNYTDPFDYAYSGLELYLVTGSVIAGEIAPGSPAEEAGFVAGDEVLAINSKFTNDLDELKKALQFEIGRTKVIIRRNGVLQLLNLKIIDIRKKQANPRSPLFRKKSN